ncbi:MAG: phosphoribosyltransferase [Candidatus Dadabacteria bacterium]|nr:phosphoribosyltransferase [Candidatus Dadabacteria bacterium]
MEYESTKLFKDRREAGIRLAERLVKYKPLENIMIIALPRGGVPVAYEVAKSLKAPLDVFITRKLRFPGNPELAAGAVAENGEIFLNKEMADYCSDGYLEEEISYQKEEIKHRQILYRGEKRLPPLIRKSVILIDDGVATGATMIATIHALRTSRVSRLIVAVPVAPLNIVEELAKVSDELVVMYTPTPFFAVGEHYDDFRQVSDEEVKKYLEEVKIEDQSRKEARL